jgi:integrase
VPDRGSGQGGLARAGVIYVPEVFALANALPVRYRALALLVTFAGLRWGELVALRRASIDLEQCEIRIMEITAELDRGDLLPETPKSRAGRRTFNFPAELADELSWHLERFAEAGEQGLVFVGPKALRFGCPTSGLSGTQLARKPDSPVCISTTCATSAGRSPPPPAPASGS